MADMRDGAPPARDDVGVLVILICAHDYRHPVLSVLGRRR